MAQTAEIAFVLIAQSQWICRSAPARDDVGTFNIDVVWKGLIAGKRAPTGQWRMISI
jgi:hypothetical protein